MCLTVTNKEFFLPQTAKENIVCYKMMKRGPKRFLIAGQRSLLSPIYPKKWYLNEMMNSNFYSSYDNDISWNLIPERVYVSKGLHSFRDYESAKEYFDYPTTDWVTNMVMCRGIIPEGALYYEGEYTAGQKVHVEYASNELFLTDMEASNVY